MYKSEIDAEPVPRLCSPEALCRRDRTNRGAIRDAISVECAAEGDGADLEMRGHAGDCRYRGILIDQRSPKLMRGRSLLVSSALKTVIAEKYRTHIALPSDSATPEDFFGL